MKLVENISVKPYNSFGIDARARYFSSFSSQAELEDILSAYPKTDRLILGGGSNVLFTGDYNGMLCKNEIPGIEELHEDPDYVYVKVGAGVNWHQFVLHCLNKNWAGLENLSLIPGSVGAAPIQNIGAYGIELQDVFWLLEAYHLHDRSLQTFTRSDCRFGYRDSVFKQQYRNQFAILFVTFRLRKKPLLHTSYGAIRQELDKMGVSEPGIRDVSEAVIRIRQSKLPDPAQIGNAGSFFKNPVLAKDDFHQLQQAFPEIVSYPAESEQRKLAAGWLIEQCGWKGYRKGDAGCHTQQALVLVNYGNAKGKEIYELSQEIIDSVKKKFGVTLEREVNIVP